MIKKAAGSFLGLNQVGRREGSPQEETEELGKCFFGFPDKNKVEAHPEGSFRVSARMSPPPEENGAARKMGSKPFHLLPDLSEIRGHEGIPDQAIFSPDFAVQFFL